jgi:aerobic-type carbon monoxide dehydrogenase small subunit (CoxS/CutS family)
MAVRINGRTVESGSLRGATLLGLIRETLGLRGTKESCGRGECGACTVLLDGRPVMSCIQFVQVTDGDVTTIEGLAEESRDLREAFAEFGGFQCGFCTSGQIVHATAVLRELRSHPEKDPEKFIRHRLSGNICRCTGYNGIVDAVLQTHQRRMSAHRKGEGAR